jgi:hypothetical protein
MAFFNYLMGKTHFRQSMFSTHSLTHSLTHPPAHPPTYRQIPNLQEITKPVYSFLKAYTEFLIEAEAILWP